MRVAKSERRADERLPHRWHGGLENLPTGYLIYALLHAQPEQQQLLRLGG